MVTCRFPCLVHVHAVRRVPGYAEHRRPMRRAVKHEEHPGHHLYNGIGKTGSFAGVQASWNR